VNEYRTASGSKQSFGREQLREGGNKDFEPEQLREGRNKDFEPEQLREGGNKDFEQEQHRESEEERIYHFDFYRIESEEETLDLGLDDYFDSGCFCFMEWPENVDGFLPDDTLDVTIEEDETGVRIIRFEN
ncbi:MAG: tRNA (adenosine(37)-N6)-threonylcarbamoyltransferase complex ATPase subunit type 1 TsaE, partial [Muribaculaceae bacterium]|nr:tRNA (adenosine(37)-N6)-threonylcarbamoyltransferase complex ATPase subunit type 1 TsaE [Muribaculaceae bacterium]